MSDADRRVLLSGRKSAGLAAIRNAMASGTASVEDIGTALRAGANCGSCLPEIKRSVAARRIEAGT